MREEEAVAHVLRTREREPDGLPPSHLPWDVRCEDEDHLDSKSIE